MVAPAQARPDPVLVRAWLDQVPDPEIPVLSVVDLGIVRDVRWDGSCLEVTITPTYSGCPATEVIAVTIEQALHDRGIDEVRLRTTLTPPWTTDWISDKGRRSLERYGIAPPAPRTPRCPRCGSADTRVISEFGSTPCKGLRRCDSCREPFEYFKCH